MIMLETNLNGSAAALKGSSVGSLPKAGHGSPAGAAAAVDSGHGAAA